MGEQIDPGAAWVCQMHPDPAKADCKVKGESSEGWQFGTSAGFVPIGEPHGQPENIEHFRQLLGKYPELVEDRHTALWWLAKQKPKVLAYSIQVRPAHSGAKTRNLALFCQAAVPCTSSYCCRCEGLKARFLPHMLKVHCRVIANYGATVQHITVYSQ